MICPSCGSWADEGDPVCPSCGAYLSDSEEYVCPRCRESFDPDVFGDECPFCGAPIMKSDFY